MEGNERTHVDAIPEVRDTSIAAGEWQQSMVKSIADWQHWQSATDHLRDTKQPMPTR